jgi:type IV pilus assembly protein PilF
MIPKLKHLLLIVICGVLLACGGNQTTNSNRSGDNNYDSRALESAQAHTNLGAAYLQKNKLEIALDEFSKAIQIMPTYAMSYNGLAMVRAALGQDEEAEFNFKKAIDLDASNSSTHNNYGTFLCDRGRYAESIEQFLEAVRNPLYTTPNLAYANAGICAERGGDVVKAEQFLKKSLQIQPLTHSAAYKLAEIEFKRGDIVAAKKTLQNALVASPNAEVLWLGVKIARALGSRNDEASYSLELRRRFPNAKETTLLLNGQ